MDALFIGLSMLLSMLLSMGLWLKLPA